MSYYLFGARPAKVGVGLGEDAFYGGAEVLFSVVGGGNDGD